MLGGSGFRFEDAWARVLSGADEGVFGWVAFNARAGTLGTSNTLGALDLGGSSLEVTFAADDVDTRAAISKREVSVQCVILRCTTVLDFGTIWPSKPS